MRKVTQGLAELGLFDGVLPIDKPSGPTSHDIVARVRRVFGLAKVGHGGTLDPNATGLLLLLLGRGTKLSNRLMGSDKCYTGIMRLGVTTDTQDCQGNIVAESDFAHITREQVEDEMKQLTGDSFQTPPMVSALKVDGVPLYKLARKGEVVERKPRFIHIYRFNLLSWDSPLVTFEVMCTKGTYVRTLAHDIGQSLGCGASLDALRRTRSGTFDVADALPYDEVLQLTPAELAARVLPFAQVAASLR